MLAGYGRRAQIRGTKCTYICICIYWKNLTDRQWLGGVGFCRDCREGTDLKGFRAVL